MTQSIATQFILFPGDNQSQAIQPAQPVPASHLIDALGLPAPRSLVVLNGGTAALDHDLEVVLKRTLVDGLARLVAEEALTVITGGTDAGIFRLFGQGLARWGRTAPCIGVAVNSLVTWPGKTAGEAPLEPNHSHFVLVAGEHWGDETSTMYDLAVALDAHCRSVAVFAGGGEIVIHEMLANVAQSRPMILLAGSGRTTDAVLAARYNAADDPRIARIAHGGNIIAHDITLAPTALHRLVRQIVLPDQP